MTRASPAEINEFVESFERAARLAKVTLDVRVIEHMAHQARAEGNEIALVINGALARAQLPEEYDDAVSHAIRAEIEAMNQPTPAAGSTRPASQPPNGRAPIEAVVVEDTVGPRLRVDRARSRPPGAASRLVGLVAIGTGRGAG